METKFLFPNQMETFGDEKYRAIMICERTYSSDA